jgi:hypothetical protein
VICYCNAQPAGLQIHGLTLSIKVNNTFSDSDYVVMNNTIFEQWIRKDVESSSHGQFSPEGLRKIQKKNCHSQTSGWFLNLGHPKHEHECISLNHCVQLLTQSQYTDSSLFLQTSVTWWNNFENVTNCFKCVCLLCGYEITTVFWNDNIIRHASKVINAIKCQCVFSKNQVGQGTNYLNRNLQHFSHSSQSNALSAE